MPRAKRFHPEVAPRRSDTFVLPRLPLMGKRSAQLYGGTKRVVSYITKELVRLGHEVRDGSQFDRVIPHAFRLKEGIFNREAPSILQFEQAFGTD